MYFMKKNLRGNTKLYPKAIPQAEAWLKWVEDDEERIRVQTSMLPAHNQGAKHFVQHHATRRLTPRVDSDPMAPWRRTCPSPRGIS